VFFDAGAFWRGAIVRWHGCANELTKYLYRRLMW